MVAAAAKASLAASGVVVADVTHLAGLVTAALIIGGVFTLGVLRSVAWAWREEREAAVEKADRLAEEASELKEQVAEGRVERQALTARLDVLEKQTNFAAYQDQRSREHKALVAKLEQSSTEHVAIVEALTALTGGLSEHTKVLARLSLGVTDHDNLRGAP